MKQTLYKLGMVCTLGITVLGYAQQGKVGINTETPTRTLDVNGDLRVRTLDNASSFNGFLVADNVGVNGTESNVVKKSEPKIRRVLGGEFPETLTLAAPSEYGQSGKVVDGTLEFLKLPTVSGNQSEDFELSANGTYYTVKKAGFYSINIKYPVLVKTDSNDSFNGDSGLILLELAVGDASTNSVDVVLRSQSITLFKGAKRPKKRVGNSVESNVRNPVYNLYASGGIFLPKGGRIYVALGLTQAYSIVNTNSNLVFNPKTSPTEGNKIQSYIVIDRIL